MNSLLETERAKYERIWALPEYRRWSPGEDAVPVFLHGVPWQKGHSVIDLGCGTGRAGLALAKAGLSVTLLDLCPSALDPQCKDLSFIEATLWAIPAWLWPFDWIFCVDTLEHIPTELVHRTLHEMATITGKGGYLQAATFHDGFGKQIGDTLHLTVKPKEWWLQQINMYWEVLSTNTNPDSRGNDGYARFFLGKSKV